VLPEPPPVAERRPVTATHFGDARTDEYGWLRDRDDPAVLAYLEAENAYAAAALAVTDPLAAQIYDEIVARIEETDVSAPVRWGPWWYYERTYEGRSYPLHCRRATDDVAFPADLDGPGEQVVLDENEVAEGHAFCSVGVLEVSPDHATCALGVDFEGDERHTLTFRSLDGGDAPTEAIADVGYAVAWTTDSRSVLYVRVDDAWRPFELWRHDLWTDPRDDRLLYREDDERFRVSVSRSRDDAALVVHLSSSMTTEVRVADATDPTSLRVLWPRRHGVECDVEHLTAPDGSAWWVATTNDGGAVDFKVVAARDDAAPSFRDVVAEVPGRRVRGVEAFRTHLAVAERRDGFASVRVLPLGEGDDPFADVESGSLVVGSDEVPATTVLGGTPEYGSATVRVAQSSLVSPMGAFDVDLATGARTLRKRQPVRGGYDAARFASARLWVTARDGTAIPVSIVHRRDLLEAGAAPGDPPASPQPLLLYGYGAYEVSIDPVFSPTRLSLLERGVVYAVAHVRGGGELGRAWYESGRLEHKVTTFLDFVDVARALVERGFTDVAHLAAMGGSAGGLLMGAAMNLAPDAFGAVVAEVPFVDALNTILDPSLPLTVNEWEEWGDPLHDPDAYARIRAWSPYDNVVGRELDGSSRRYPALLALGSLNDTRVSYWEPAKWVAKLRAANRDNPIVLKTDLGAGHGGPSGRYDAWRERAMIYAWVADRLGATSTGP
jgi:oligopeptidase B